MSSEALEVRLDDASVTELRDWASLWSDLLHVDMVLHAREDIPRSGETLFVRRALWESAVISYGRTATSGRRQQQVEELLVSLGRDAEAFHVDVMAWRHQHVAHRVDPAREQTEARAVIDVQQQRIKAIRVRVSPILGPEDEEDDLATRLKKYVEELRNLVWTQRIEVSEKKAIEENSGQLAVLLEAAKSREATDDEGFSIDIDPSGGDS